MKGLSTLCFPVGLEREFADDNNLTILLEETNARGLRDWK